jgi:hypothetical protein
MKFTFGGLGHSDVVGHTNNREPPTKAKGAYQIIQPWQTIWLSLLFPFGVRPPSRPQQRLNRIEPADGNITYLSFSAPFSALIQSKMD